jgi:MerR family transcriptional regulator, light-induced transcriptional regulator
MSGDPDLETVFDSIHPGEAEVSQGLPRHSKRSLKFRSDDRIHSVLSEAVRRMALPRLLAARLAERDEGQRIEPSVTDDDRERFLAVLATPDHHLTESFISVLGLRGVTREDILLQLFTPVARDLHQLWMRDEVTFADVTLAIGRLQRLLRSPALPDAPLHFGGRGGSILIAPPPGDPHAFGSAVFEDFFRNAEWATERLIPATQDELINRVSGKGYDVLAISIAQQCSVETLSLLIRRIRRESANTQLLVIVGGQPLRDEPEMWRRIGADGTAPDAAAAVRVANKLLRAILHGEHERRY